MASADRRSVLGIALGAALAPALISRQAVAQSSGLRSIAPPAQPMTYRRSLERFMRGGESFKATRDFSVRMTSHGLGYRVEGFQTAVRVEAPASLHQFVDLEERRVEDGVFPLTLDAAGLITEGRGPVAFGPEVEIAMESVRQTALRVDGPDVDELRQLVSAMHQAGAGLITYLPQDIFAPVTSDRTDRRIIELPWGDTGSVTTIFHGERDPVTGLMCNADREVITEMAGDRRRTLESWQLGCADEV